MRPVSSEAVGVEVADAEFDVHGIVGIRVVGGTDDDVAAVRRQLDTEPVRLGRAADITIRFVDHLPARGTVRAIGRHDAGCTDDAFLLLEGPAPVMIPMEDLGGPVELVCEHGAAPLPLLPGIINLTASARGVVPVHGTAFLHGGVGILTTGWSKGGKTESLLGFLQHGAEYVGDEVVLVTGDGERLLGVPHPIRLWAWHLRDAPSFTDRLTPGERRRLRTLRLARSTLQRVPGGVPARVEGVLADHDFVTLEPARLTDARVPSAPFDRLFLLESAEQPDVTVEPIDAELVARRMAFSLEYERLDLFDAYVKFRFAFPDRENPHIEQAREHQRAMLLDAFRGKPAHVVRHPYPVAVDDLFTAMAPYC